MADKILHNMEMPICVGYGSASSLESACGVMFTGELALATDTGVTYICASIADFPIPITERWRVSASSDTTTASGASMMSVSLQYLPGGSPASAFSLNFQGPSGSTNWYLVLENV